MVHEDTPEGVTTEDAGSGLALRFRDSAWGVTLPEGWRRVESLEDDLWLWELDGVATARVRIRRAPRVQVEIDVVNLSGDVATLFGPRVVLESDWAVVRWFAGSAGEVVLATSQETSVWVQLRGSCVADGDGFTVFAEPLLLRPGQASSAVWRREVLPADVIPTEPAWVPRQRYFRRGDALEVDHTDAALAGEGLDIGTTSEGSRVEGPAGLHHLAFLDARGTALVEVGWFVPLDALADSVLVERGLDPNLKAWLLAATPTGMDDVDALDIALAEALEDPSPWGVMAGMRAATLTDLPVDADVRRAAQRVWEGEPDVHVRRMILTHALISGWEPVVTGTWMQSFDADEAMIPSLDMLATIGFGRITSTPLQHGGREVLLARWWLAAHGESARTLEWEHAVDTARARLMCALSETRYAHDDVAWLLAENLLT